MSVMVSSSRLRLLSWSALLFVGLLGVGTAWSSRTLPPPDRPRPGTLRSASQCRHDRDCTSRFEDLDRGRCDPAGRRVEAFDLNADGKPDLWKLHGRWRDRGAVPEWMTCRELDLNADGRPDVSLHLDRQGRDEIMESDLDADGKVDLITVRTGPGLATRIDHRVGPGTACRQQRCQPR